MNEGIDNITGPWVSGDNLFGRTQERQDLADRVRAGASVSLVAPRRVGKTSLLRAVAGDLNAEFHCLFIDLEAATTPEEAIAEIAVEAAKHQGLGTKVAGWLKRWLPNVSVDTAVGSLSLELRDALQVDWQRRGQQLLADLVAGDKGVVLFIDELPILVRALLRTPASDAARSPADVFLSWLRKLMQEHNGKLRLVVTGSIGLAPMVARAGLTATLNALEHETLRPWSPVVTRQAIEALARRTKLTMGPGAVVRMVEQLGIGVPFHVQLFFKHVLQHAKHERLPTVLPAHVDQVWEQRLLVDHTDLPHWEQRLKAAVDDGHEPIARRLLTTAAASEPLTHAQARALCADVEVLRAIIDVLEHDGYFARRDDGWYFPNRLLRAWWERKHAGWEQA